MVRIEIHDSMAVDKFDVGIGGMDKVLVFEGTLENFKRNLFITV